MTKELARLQRDRYREAVAECNRFCDEWHTFKKSLPEYRRFRRAHVAQEEAHGQYLGSWLELSPTQRQEILDEDKAAGYAVPTTGQASGTDEQPNKGG